jgi:hypothetical protein
VVGRSGGGAWSAILAWPHRQGFDGTLPSADRAIRELLSMWRSVVVAASGVAEVGRGLIVAHPGDLDAQRVRRVGERVRGAGGVMLVIRTCSHDIEQRIARAVA